MSNGVAHSLYLVIELNSNKQIQIIISKFTFFFFLFFFSFKFHVCLTLVIKKTKVRKKNCKLVTVTSLVRCGILDTGSRECSTSAYFRPIRVKSVPTVGPKGIKNLGTAYSHIVSICWPGPSCSKGG